MRGRRIETGEFHRDIGDFFSRLLIVDHALDRHAILGDLLQTPTRDRRPDAGAAEIRREGLPGDLT